MVQQSQDQSDWAVASFDPADQTQGGLFGEANGLISDAEFVFWDYQGKAPPTIALKLKIVDDEGAENEQVWSVGHPTRVAIVNGGASVATPTKGLPGGSNVADLMRELVNAGFPVNKFTGNCKTDLIGLYGFWRRKPAPKRDGLPQTAPAEGEQQRERTVLYVSKIHKLPWENKGAVPTNTNSGGAAPNVGGSPVPQMQATAPVQAAISANGDLASDAANTVLTALATVGEPLTKAQLSVWIINNYEGDPKARVSIIGQINKDDFLGSIAGVKFENGVISLG